MKRTTLLLLLLTLLPCTMGFALGSQTDIQEVLEKASFIPKLEEYYSKPTVETTASYEGDKDAWRVILTEQTSGKIIARFNVADDTGKVSGVRISQKADEIEYPELSEQKAIKLAAASPEVRDELSKHGPYSTKAKYEAGEWTVRFYVDETGAVGGRPTEEGKEVATVGVDDSTWVLNYVYTGDQVGWNMARGIPGAYGKQANYWWVWLPLALAFAAAFWRTDRLLSLRNLDVVALLGFLVSHGFFREGIVYEAVILWYPPLIYLLFRTLLMGFGIGERVEKTSNLPVWLLMTLAGLAGGLLLGLNVDSRVIDVGYAGVVGADRILDGTIPYGHMPPDVGTGDTYGPLNYLLYVPFVLMFGFSGEWDFLPAAHALTLFSFVAGAMALFIAGYRLSGPKGAAALILAWAAFPYTIYATNNNTNDVIVAAVSAIGLATAASPLARGATMAAGFAVKLYPIVLGPLWITYEGPRRKPIIDFVLGGIGVGLVTFWVILLDGHPVEVARLFYQKTLAFQGDRVSPWTIFSQVPDLAFLQRPLTAFAIFLAALVAFVPRKKTLRRLAALSAAIVIAFQLTVNYWFYTYVIWFEPFVFLALLLSTNEKTALDSIQLSAISYQQDGENDEEREKEHGQ
ncbi:MAG TPA: glycosyltransferase family 87 protein [Rubrobacter sp.]|nr:glycosyltransferase family 87 protein [Rubrobacter sp.]